MFGQTQPVCGLYYNIPCNGGMQQAYLPQVEVKVHASILATTSRTVLKQTFANPSTTRGIREVRYTFPLYDGVSVVGFSCQVGNRTIVGEVKEKESAKALFKNAVARGETAGLLEQLPAASDVFTTTIGNIPPSARVVINITYLGELKHDMEVDGIRFTIPTSISPRYGSFGRTQSFPHLQMDGVISITVDAETAEGSFIQKLQSPTHPISMSMGTTSVEPDAVPSMSKASATLSLGTAHLETDFILQIIAKDTGIPRAVLETHPSISNHRALMATLVPKFALPGEKPEIVFVCDQSGSMEGTRMDLAIEALQVFLKSLPVGVKFNICSFGSEHSFMLPKSVSYNQETLDYATHYVGKLQANYGGTEMLRPLQATIENRYKDMPLDVILLTDGETWNQQDVFDYLNKQIQVERAPIRVFTLGIGSGVSHALIEGIAKAGNGFSQSVQEGEKMSGKVVRMLKGALSPHVDNYTLEVKYTAAEESDDFEIVEKVADSLKVKLDLKDKEDKFNDKQQKKPISLFDTSADLDDNLPIVNRMTREDRYAHLMPIPSPKILQAPQEIPPLFAFNRTTVYLLLGPEAPRATPTSVILRGTSNHGPLELEIPIQVLDSPSETIHQLAAKKAVSELEQGRGWLAAARDADGQLLKTRFDGRFSDMVEREAVRLGVQFQVGGKWCSFVATEKTPKNKTDQMDLDWEYLEDEKRTERTEQRSLFAGMGFGQVAQQQTTQQQSLFGQQPANSGARLFSTSLSHSARSGNHGGGFVGASTVNHQNPSAMMQQQQQQQQQKQWSMPSGTSSLFGSSASPAAPSLRSVAANEPYDLSHSQMAKPAFGQIKASPPFFGGASSAGVSSAPAAHALQDYQMQCMMLEQQNKKRLLMSKQPTGHEALEQSAVTDRNANFYSGFAAGANNFSPLASHGAEASGGFSAYGAQEPSSPGYHQYSKTLPGRSSSRPQPDESAQGQDLSSGVGDEAPLENFDFDSFLHEGKDDAVLNKVKQRDLKDHVFESTEKQTPAASSFSVNSSDYAHNSPGYAPNLSRFAPTSPQYSPTSPVYSPTSPVYSPTSPVYSPTSPVYSPTSPVYSPTSPVYSPTSPVYSLASPVYSIALPQYSPSSPRYSSPSLRDGSQTPSPPSHPLSPDALLLLLIKHQFFNGSFAYNAPILEHLGTSVAEFNQCLLDASLESNNAGDSVALFTALLVVYMERKMQEFQGAWELVVEKARAWLEEVCADHDGDTGVLLKAAGALVAA
ncbi:uncharacterized protein EKO05_0010382 [Ascochyta rabiei]|uniref:Uncharacterized protein n=1 Tax=Didymella rabiei TaxID=5454 RepID=A0A162W9U3_DIDRA|nr:uncharacterized protein EKO05_0010382 [Ascochyta rabiei]KZM18901.1 hypothetical protein ST47_g9957 [Ascochyta rabiei]UPX20139.1 hypothetical protein EKO05_0010382 [Ascochyta rabiei]